MKSLFGGKKKKEKKEKGNTAASSSNDDGGAELQVTALVSEDGTSDAKEAWTIPFRDQPRRAPPPGLSTRRAVTVKAVRAAPYPPLRASLKAGGGGGGGGAAAAAGAAGKAPPPLGVGREARRCLMGVGFVGEGCVTYPERENAQALREARQAARALNRREVEGLQRAETARSAHSTEVRARARVAEEHTWQVAERRDVDSKRRERQTVRLCLRACIRERKRKREKNGTIYRSSISLRAK